MALRFVRGPDGALVPDLAERLPGRGAWVGAERARLVRAASKGAFAKAFRAQTTIAEGGEAFADRTEHLLAEQALRGLGLARRAGQLFVGFEAVRERADRLSAYLTPSDASPDGVAKVAARLAATTTAPHIPLPVTSEPLSAAVGEPGAVHVGLGRGKAGLSALRAVRLWIAFRAGS